MGRDLWSLQAINEQGTFQSTRPRGARLFSYVFPTPLNSFNPRARVGRDAKVDLIVDYNARFNPRARVGRDADLSDQSGVVVEFQSTRPRGARPAVPRVQHLDGIVSIHAPAWGATEGPHHDQR